MSGARLTSAITLCLFGTAIGWWAIRNSWLLSFLAGPLQHLGLAFSRLDNSGEYLDGLSRVGMSEYLMASLQGILWIIGVGAVICSIRSGAKLVMAIVVFSWIIVGVINVFFFAIRSV